MVKVIGFHTGYERLPVIGDPLKDEVDARGFKLDGKGKRVMSMQEVDWCTYVPSHSALNSQLTERIKHLRPSEDMVHGEQTEKSRFMSVRWSQIEKEYIAYKTGQEIPLHGTPLAAWSGVTREAGEVLKRLGIKTVEEIRDLVESQMDRIQLPNVREMRRSAAAFLANKETSDAAQREADRDAEITLLKAQIAEQNDRLAAAMELLEEKTQPDDGGNELADLRAECDRRGVKYHPNAKADTLRARLTQEAA